MATYRRPGFVVRRVLNPVMMFVAGRLGREMRGAWELTVPGRKTGTPRSVPVNPLDVGGRRYLVAPRGATEWVRNLGAAGGGTLTKGKTVERFTAQEAADAEKLPILREYLNRWGRETAGQFGLSSARAPDEELPRIAVDHPVFVISA